MTTRPWLLALDFGTSYTVAAARAEGRAAEIIEIDGNRRIPSVVLADGSTLVAGTLADELAASYPQRALRAPKRRIGDSTPVVLDGRPYQIVDVIAALLRHVYTEAVRHYGGPPSEVRLTHPAVWARPQLSRLLEAAAVAGIPNPVLVPEPVAAALAYATEVGVASAAHVAVYDLGGGTFDTAVVTPTPTGFQIVGRPGGDPNIGGELFDELLFEHVGAQLDPAAFEAIRYSDEPTWRRLHANMWSEVRRAKELLSGYPVAEILLSLPSGLAPVSVTRAEYEALIDPHLDATIDLLDRCVRNAGTNPDRLAAIYLVGGASRTPLIGELLQQRFPDVPMSRRGDPKTSTALGAVLAVRSGAPPRAAGQGSPTPTPTPTPTPIAGEPTAPAVITQPTPTTPPPAARPPATPPPATGPPRQPPITQPTPTLFGTPVPPPRKRHRWPIVVFVLVLLAGAGIAAAALLLPSDDTEEVDTGTGAYDVDAGTQLCVRADIESAALRTDPSRDADLLATMPTGACEVTALGEPAVENGAYWIEVAWNGLEGFSAQANFDEPVARDADSAEAVVNEYYNLVSAGDYDAAWERLTKNQQDEFDDFESFSSGWEKIDEVTISTFVGCTPDAIPTSCHFFADFANQKGGVSRVVVTLTVVDDAGTLRIDETTEFEFVECIQTNDGEDGCSSG